ncbi:MAG: hypothetical protein ABIY48_01335 [Acidimicrobiales bacterium]
MTTSPEPRANPRLSEPTGRPGDPSWYTGRFELVLYLLAGLSYVAVAVFHKFILNWIVGPIWLVAWVWGVPVLIDRVRRRRSG